MFEMTYPFLEAIDHKISRVAFTNYTIALYSFSLLCVGICVWLDVHIFVLSRILIGS